MNLFFKECNQVRKSLIYFVFILVVSVFYFSQFGNEISSDIETVKDYNNTSTEDISHQTEKELPLIIKPNPNDSFFGTKYAVDPEQIMPSIVETLVREYIDNCYTTYPIMFYKAVILTDAEQKQIADYYTKITGISDPNQFYEVTGDLLIFVEPEDLELNATPIYDDQGRAMILNPEYNVPIIVSYDEFKIIMKEICEILGKGSSYEESNFETIGRVNLTYEERLQEYTDFIETDEVTNAYARLFCDYMGIVVAFFGTFVPVSFLLRDKKAAMTQLIYSRKISSTKIILSKYFALVLMLVLPFIVISVIPLIQIQELVNLVDGVKLDMFAFIKYIIAWILPTIMITTALAFILTILFDSPIGIIIGFVWGFFDMSSSMDRMQGGNYGTELTIRHNTVGNLQNMINEIDILIINRVGYVVLSLIVVGISIYIYELKRRGRVNIGGSIKKLFRNNKNANKT